MNKLTQTLLTGAALCALMAAPVMAQPKHPAMRVTALHAGHEVNKTKGHVPGAQHVTYTFWRVHQRVCPLRRAEPRRHVLQVEQRQQRLLYHLLQSEAEAKGSEEIDLR